MVNASKQHEAGSGQRLHCVVVTPEATVVDTEAEFVALPLFDGEIGIAPAHTPLIGRLGYGELRVRSADQTRRYYVDGGFVQVVDNLVSVLTGRAIAAEELDPEVVDEQLTAARNRPANSPDLMALRDRAILQARSQLRVAKRRQR